MTSIEKEVVLKVALAALIMSFLPSIVMAGEETGQYCEANPSAFAR
ncbi:hypothetical protein [Vibrio parahaemolyticus]